MGFAVSSEDITLAQSFLHLLDQRFGGKARAFLVVVAGLIPTIVGGLNFFISHADYLPATGATAQITAAAAGVLVFLGKFTPFFNAVVAPPAKDGAAVSISNATPPALVPVEPVEPIQDLQLPPPPPQLQAAPVPVGDTPKPVPVAVPVE